MISLCHILTYTYSRLVLQESAIKVIMTIYLSITSTGINNTNMHYILARSQSMCVIDSAALSSPELNDKAGSA